jgi:hypothetical protein
MNESRSNASPDCGNLRRLLAFLTQFCPFTSIRLFLEEH